MRPSMRVPVRPLIAATVPTAVIVRHGLQANGCYIDAWVAAAMPWPRSALGIHPMDPSASKTNSAHEWCYLCQGVAQLSLSFVLDTYASLSSHAPGSLFFSTFCIPSSRFHPISPLLFSHFYNSTLHSFPLVSAVELQLPIFHLTVLRSSQVSLTHSLTHRLAPRGDSLGADTLFMKRHA